MSVEFTYNWNIDDNVLNADPVKNMGTPTLKLNISSASGNFIEIREDGLYVNVDYSDVALVSDEEGNIIEERYDGLYAKAVDLSDYYSKEETYSKDEVDEKLDAINKDLGDIDLSDYPTKEEMTEQINSVLGDIETLLKEI